MANIISFTNEEWDKQRYSKKQEICDYIFKELCEGYILYLFPVTKLTPILVVISAGYLKDINLHCH
jgi:hypothetical protein